MLANKALGPWASGPRALLANIPTPLNFQLGNTGSISHLTSRNNHYFGPSGEALIILPWD